MATFKHLVSWHTGDIFAQGSDSYTSVQQVRKIHEGVRRAMNRDEPGGSPSGKTWISMYNMGCVQARRAGLCGLQSRQYQNLG